MKRVRHLTALLLTAVVAVTSGIRVKADYKYKVTLLAGLYGTINGQEKVVFEVPINDTVTLGNNGDQVTVTYGGNTYTVTVKTDAQAGSYYCKGFHASGVETVLSGDQKITEDTIYVASYGIRAKKVAYTAKFVDANGKTLAADRTFYGNVGDKPAVSYIYLEGYVPEFRMITDKLSENPEDNVFTFVYRPAEPIPGGGGGGTTGQGGVTYIDDGTEIVYLPATNNGRTGTNANTNTNGNANTAGTAGRTDSTANTATANTTDDSANAAAAPAAGDSEANAAADAGNDKSESGEILDLETTTGGSETASNSAPAEAASPVNPSRGLSPVWVGAIACSGVGVVALAGILVTLAKRRKDQQPQS